MESIRWTETHDELQAVMKRELETMRQLLANMSLEEQFILQQEQRYWGSMLQERAGLTAQLSAIRCNRIGILHQLESLMHQPHATLEDLLPSFDTNSWEILSLRDQMLTLLERMNLQTSRNEMLLRLANASVRPPMIDTKKRKVIVATLPPLESDKNES